jgi:hypothetical protein
MFAEPDERTSRVAGSRDTAAALEENWMVEERTDAVLGILTAEEHIAVVPEKQKEEEHSAAAEAGHSVVEERQMAEERNVVQPVKQTEEEHNAAVLHKDHELRV